MRSLSRNSARSSAGGRHGLEIIGAVEPGGAVEVGRADLAQRLEIIARRVFGAVEHQMLEQMREAGPAGRLVLRADIVPDGDRDDRRLAVLVDDDAQAVVEGEGLVRDVDPAGRAARTGSAALRRRAAGAAAAATRPEAAQRRRASSRRRTRSAVKQSCACEFPMSCRRRTLAAVYGQRNTLRPTNSLREIAGFDDCHCVARRQHYIPSGSEQGRDAMNLEKFTDRARGFLQSAQTVASRMNHQRIAPDPSAQGAARGRAGHGRGADRARRRQRRGGAARDRRGAGQDAGRLGQRRQRGAGARRRDHPRCSTRPSRSPRRPAIATSPSSGCCSRWPVEDRRRQGARRCRAQGRGAQRGDQRTARRPHRRHRERRGPLRRAEEIRARPHRRRRATASSIR